MVIESSIFTLWQFPFLKQNGNLAQRLVVDYALNPARTSDHEAPRAT
jgi:hypothetical protein